jgi:acyl-CoA thioester hydrolase
MNFKHSVPLRFSDTDAMGHVNHARFLTYLEDSRVAFLVKLGDNAAFAPGLIVARVEIDYVKPIMLAVEPVQVELWVERVGGKSFTIGYEMSHQGEVVARSKSVIVAFDYAAQKSRSLSDAEREALGEYSKDS